MRHRPGRLLRAALAGVATALALTAVPAVAPAGAPAGLAATAARAATDPWGLPVEVRLDAVTTTAVGPAGSFTVTGLLTNGGTRTLDGVLATLRLADDPLLTRAAVTGWAARASTAPAGVNVAGARIALDGPLAPGDRVPFSITVPGTTLAARLGDTFGPRGVSVAVTSVGAGGTSRAGLGRTVLTWQPAGAALPAPVEVSVVVPLTAGTGQADGATPDDRLARLLQGSSGRPVTYVLDPALLGARAPAATTVDTPTGTPTGPAGVPPATPVPGTTGTPGTGPDPTQTTSTQPTTWLDLLTATTDGRQVLTTAWGDPDLTSVIHAGATGLLDAATARADAVLASTEAGDGTFAQRAGPRVAWPADGAADAATVTAAVADGTGLALLADSRLAVAEGEVPAVGALRVTTTAGELAAVPVDTSASVALAATATGAGTPESSSALATLRAELAAASVETAGTGATTPARVTLTLPRTLDVDADRLGATVDALAATTWARLAPVTTSLEGTPSPDVLDAAVRYPASAVARELAPGHVDAVAGARDDALAFTPALVEPGTVLEPLEARALSLVSVAWRGRTAEELAAARSTLVGDVRALYSSVTVVRGSRILLLGSSADLPIRVSNSSPHRLRVSVALRPLTGQLRAEETTVVEVRPEADATAVVPVRTVANGDVAVAVSVSVPDGADIGTPTTLQVRVRRDWESRGLALAGGVLAVLLVVGLVRSLRRRDARIRPEDVPDFDLLAAEEERRLLNPEPQPQPDRQPDPERAEQPPEQRPEHGPGTPGPPVEPAETVDEDATSTTDVARSSAVMAAGTLVSRILGFVRNALLAAAIGLSSSTADAFGVANNVPNIIYMLLAGSVLNAVLVPQITRAARQGEAGREFVDRLVTLTLAVVLVVTVVVTLAAPLVVGLYTSNQVPDAQVALSVAFAFWCLPQVLFYGLYAVWGQVLNARGAFGAYTWAPVVNNVVAIAGLVAYVAVEGLGAKDAEDWTPATIALLAGSATLGVAAQAFFLLPFLRRSGWTWRPRWGVRGAGLRSASTMAAWTFAAVVVTQLAFLVTSNVLTRAGDLSRQGDASIAASLPIYSNAFLLFMLPHSIITVSLVTALFTRMSHAAGVDDRDAVRADLSFGLRVTSLATVPASAFMLAAGTLVTAVIFPGNTVPETRGTGLAAAAMMLGLTAFSAQYLVQRVHYAYEDARTPFWAQLPATALTVTGSVAVALLVPAAWAVVGIGLVMTASTSLGLLLTSLRLRRRLGSLDGRRVGGVVVRAAAAAGVAALGCFAVVRLLGPVLDDVMPGSWSADVVTLAVAGGVMGALYWVGLRALHVSEVDDLARPVLARLGRRPSG